MTPIVRWRHEVRANGGHYVVSPMGRAIDIANASPDVFRICAIGMGLTVTELADLIEEDIDRVQEAVPPTEPAGAEADEMLAKEGRER